MHTGQSQPQRSRVLLITVSMMTRALPGTNALCVCPHLWDPFFTA